MSYLLDLESCFKDQLNELDSFLRNYLEGRKKEVLKQSLDLSPLFESLEYTLFQEGKRFRPLLVFCYSHLLNIPTKEVLPLAAAIEMIHTGALIHDDLPSMDNDSLRRGKAAHHKVFGEDVALLAGDILFVEPFHLLCLYEQNLQMIKCVSKAASLSGMMGGQFLDLKSHHSKREDIESIHSFKTGALIQACLDGVLTLTKDVRPSDRESLKNYSKNLSQLFQWADDLQDKAKKEETSILNYLKPKEVLRILELKTQDCLKSIEVFGDKSKNLKTLALFNLKRVL